MTTFDGWQSFYEVTGEAAATLTGLLFVVVSFMSGREASKTVQGVKLFMSPKVFHLVSVLVISALALVPEGEAGAAIMAMTTWAALGLIYAVVVAARIHAAPEPAHWSDFWWYGVAPAVAFVALTAATASAWASWPHAAGLVALCLMTLLVVTIRNAWDLVTWLAPRRDKP